MGRRPGGTQKKTYDEIMEVTMRCLSEKGHKATTFQIIASEARVSTALVVQHFKEAKSIFPMAFEYFMRNAQKVTAERLVRDGMSARERLTEYIDVSFELVTGSPGGKVYLLIYYFGVFEPHSNFIHNQVKTVAVNRVADILSAGIHSGEFKVDEVLLTARSIHDLLVGALLSSFSSEQNRDFNKLKSRVIAHALILAGFRKK